MTFLLLLIPALACALIVGQNLRAEKLIRTGQREKALADSKLDDFFVPMVLVGAAILFYVVAYLVFPIK